MQIKSDILVLSTDEFNALNKIASATKMDCWFYIEEQNGIDYIYDLENDCQLDLKEAVMMLFEGMVEPVEDEFYNLTKVEIDAFNNLVKKFLNDDEE